MKKILVVDDKPEIRELVEITLKSDNYRILQAENGDDAVKIAKSEKPDLIIMDIMMPGKLDGYDATRIIKNEPKTKDCKIIILSAKGQEIDKKEGYNAGANDYFVKPFSPLDLIKKVEEILE